MPLGSNSKTKPTPPTHSTTPSPPGSTPASPARKAPHCRQCHRPRKGHPARGCPYVEALSSPTVSDAESEAPAPPKPAVKSSKSPTQRTPLLAKGPQKNEATPPPYQDTIPNPAKSSTSKRVSKETTHSVATARRAPSPAFKVWKETLEETVPQTPLKRSLRSSASSSKTPETLPAYDPNSRSKLKSKSTDKPLPIPPLSAPPDSSYEISSRPKTATPGSSSARRAVQAAFVSELAEEAGASIHLIPSPKAKTIEKQAHALGLVTQVFVDDDSDEALLVVGRCQFAVDRFLHMGGGRRAAKAFGSTTRGRTSV